ncbi:sugar transferase [Pleurocapsa sp. CCALA 161]|uniref:sugar transferase n=1 Tax=Pleurocapsa sp. CCALA 161 TaxID=2107688 RepID=UPI001E5126CF|nr:sugar transferase [Pleurocapsa sp. CCALA 161]
MLYGKRSSKYVSTLLMYSHTSRMIIVCLLVIGDIIGLLLCFNLALELRVSKSLDLGMPILYALIAIYLFGLYLTDTYKLNREVSGVRLSERAILGIVATVAAVTSLIYITGLWGSEPIVGRGVLLISVGLFSIWAVISRTIVDGWLKTNQQPSRFLVLGDDRKVVDFGKEHRKLNSPTEFVSFTDFASENSDVYNQSNSNTAVLNKINGLNSTWKQQYWSGILIDGADRSLSQQMVRDLMDMRLRGVYVYSIADFCERFWQKIPPAYVQDDWFAFTSGFNILHNRIKAKLKQLIDIVVAAVMIVVSLPITIPVAIAIKLSSPGAIFYSQVRTGLNGKKFRVYKFRSMYQNAESKGIQWAKTKDPRITKVGSFIRLTRIDELPQLWNVFKGEMSLVGPRPERPEFDMQLREQIPYYDVRYLVKPGITGWAQVCYPYGASVEDAYQKVAYDLYYIKNYSLLMDLGIAFKTLRVVILGKGR